MDNKFQVTCNPRVGTDQQGNNMHSQFVTIAINTQVYVDNTNFTSVNTATLSKNLIKFNTINDFFPRGPKQTLYQITPGGKQNTLHNIYTYIKYGGL